MSKEKHTFSSLMEIIENDIKHWGLDQFEKGIESGYALRIKDETELNMQNEENVAEVIKIINNQIKTLLNSKRNQKLKTHAHLNYGQIQNMIYRLQDAAMLLHAGEEDIDYTGNEFEKLSSVNTHIAEFTQKCLKRTGKANDKVKTSTLYHAFEKFCEDNKYEEIATRADFSKYMRKIDCPVKRENGGIFCSKVKLK